MKQARLSKQLTAGELEGRAQSHRATVGFRRTVHLVRIRPGVSTGQFITCNIRNRPPNFRAMITEESTLRFETRKNGPHIYNVLLIIKSGKSKLAHVCTVRTYN